MARHQHLHERLRRAVAFFALDQHLVDVARIEVADRALDQVAFLVDQSRRGRAQCQLADLVPQAQQVFVVALDLGFRALGAGGAHDHPHAFGDIELFQNILQPAAVGQAGDFARNAAAARRVRHQHAIAAGERQIGRQRRALVAALLLGDLDQHDLPALDHLLDLVVPVGARALASRPPRTRRRRGFRRFRSRRFRRRPPCALRSLRFRDRSSGLYAVAFAVSCEARSVAVVFVIFPGVRVVKPALVDRAGASTGAVAFMIVQCARVADFNLAISGRGRLNNLVTATLQGAHLDDIDNIAAPAHFGRRLACFGRCRKFASTSRNCRVDHRLVRGDHDLVPGCSCGPARVAAPGKPTEVVTSGAGSKGFPATSDCSRPARPPATPYQRAHRSGARYRRGQ